MMRSKSIYLICFTFVFSIFSCVNPPDYPDTPEISELSVSKDTVNQTGETDPLVLRFHFTDGDGDIADSLTHHGVQIIDERDGNKFTSFNIPNIPKSILGNGISGFINVELPQICCIYPNPTIPPCFPNANYPSDTVTFSIQLIDQAGHESNQLSTPPIYINCN